jgi:hypothetical protein
MKIVAVQSIICSEYYLFRVLSFAVENRFKAKALTEYTLGAASRALT